VKVTGSGFDENKRRLEEIAARMRNLRPALTVAAQDTATLIDDSFERSVAPDGGAWPALNARTIASRRRGGGSGQAKPLVDTARLRRSITTNVGNTGFTFGTNVAYGGTHQSGRGRIPARPYLPVAGSSGRYALMTGGRAGAHWTRIRSDVAHYIRTGELR
jgi:phage gpG-like protein